MILLSWMCCTGCVELDVLHGMCRAGCVTRDVQSWMCYTGCVVGGCNDSGDWIHLCIQSPGPPCPWHVIIQTRLHTYRRRSSEDFRDFQAALVALFQTSRGITALARTAVASTRYVRLHHALARVWQDSVC